jgi:hypothetical protein
MFRAHYLMLDYFTSLMLSCSRYKYSVPRLITLRISDCIRTSFSFYTLLSIHYIDKKLSTHVTELKQLQIA